MVFNSYQYFQLAALILALIFWRGLKHCRLLLFIPLLIVINAVETIANNYVQFGWKQNHFIYNIYLLTGTPMWLFLYLQMLGLEGKAKKLFTGIIFLVTCIILLNYFFLQGAMHFNTYSLVFTMILNIVFSTFVLFRLAMEEEFMGSINRHPFFWISASHLLLSMAILVLLGLQQYILTNNLRISNKSLYYALLPGINIIFYIGLGFSFFLCHRQLRLLSSSSPSSSS